MPGEGGKERNINLPNTAAKIPSLSIAFSLLVLLSLACLSSPALPTIDIQRAIEATLTAWASPQVMPSPEIDRSTFPETLPTLIPPPTMTFTPAAGAACLPPDAPFEIGLVTQVIDGDTISVLIDNQVYPVRYIGIDAPETKAPGEPAEPKGEEATALNRSLVEGQIVTLVKDISETDRFNRLLRYVFVPDLNGIFVNHELVRSGCAEALAYPPDVACNAFFEAAEREARAERLCLWAPTPTRTSPAIIAPPPPPKVFPTPTSDCPYGDPSYPTVCIPPPPPDLDRRDIPYRRFKVLPPDPHNFDGDHDGIGCELG